MRTSRPLRALAVVVGGWVAVRMVFLWPQPAPPAAIASAPPARVPLARAVKNLEAYRAVTRHVLPPPQKAAARAAEPPRRLASSKIPQIKAKIGPTAAAASGRTLSVAPPETISPPPTMADTRDPRSHRRISISGWAIVRGEAQDATIAPGGVLGASQAGVRAIWEPGPRGIGLTARLSSPLSGKAGREASLGIALRKGAVGVLIEQRIALQSGLEGRPSITVFGGFGRTRGRLHVEGYAQGGVVGVADVLAFADGALRVERTFEAPGLRLSAGGAVSGGAQPGLTRVDAGPLLAARVPVAGGGLRITAEWRFRIGGNAAPGSGPALTLGTDF